ncbi:MAG: 50S ribosomal protein L11 methyltransferase [Rhodomicrobium sp.]
MAVTLKTVLGFRSEREAMEASAILGEMPGFESFPLVVLEENGQWFVECYDDGALTGDAAAGALQNAGVTAASQNAVTVPDADWVAETQRLLPPVRAGRFIVHGSHVRRQAFSQWAIEIDAGRAFGTAHHGTTKGCLLAIGRLPAAVTPRTVLDLGTGSGVLAIAAAKAFAHRIAIAAADIDPVAIAVAQENCRKNGVAGSIGLFVGDGLKPSFAYTSAPFDIVIANILAKPLLKLAPRLRILTRRGGVLILSGLLTEQAREILARYFATGFCLIRRHDLEGWATLMLRRVR